MLLGALGSGWLTEQFDWRVTFIVVGAPGILVAIIAMLTLRELPRGHSEGLVDSGETPGFKVALRTLLDRPAYLHLVAGLATLNFAFFAFLAFYHPLLVRKFAVGYSDAAMVYGLVTGISCGIGYLAAGFLADRFGQRDERWYLWVPALGALISGPAFACGLMLDWAAAIPFFVIGGIGACCWYGPGSAVMHRSVEPRMRATAVALAALITLGLGIAIGPPAVGLLSDKFGEDGLSTALLVVSPMYLWAACHFALGARHLGKRADV
jgi:MFS family permease